MNESPNRKQNKQILNELMHNNIGDLSISFLLHRTTKDFISINHLMHFTMFFFLPQKKQQKK